MKIARPFWKDGRVHAPSEGAAPRSGPVPDGDGIAGLAGRAGTGDRFTLPESLHPLDCRSGWIFQISYFIGMTGTRLPVPSNIEAQAADWQDGSPFRRSHLAHINTLWHSAMR